jgi:hypothetical protein
MSNQRAVLITGVSSGRLDVLINNADHELAGALEELSADSAVQSLLDRWATWHWIRTGLGIRAFVAVLRAFQRS